VTTNNAAHLERRPAQDDVSLDELVGASQADMRNEPSNDRQRY